MKSITTTCFLTLLLHFQYPVLAQNKVMTGIDAYVNEMLVKYKIPGASIAVIKDGRLVKKANYGLASVEFNLPVNDSTVFALASVTKIFTSSVIMKLAETKKLSIDDPVTNYIDSLPESWKAIKLRHLLAHTAGLVNHFQTKKWRAGTGNTDKLTLRQVIQYSADEPLLFTPGDQFSYSVTGYMVLGLIVEKAGGKPINVLAKEMLFDPLKMNSTHYGDFKAVIKNRNSLVYTYQNGPFETWNFTYGASGTTAAGLNSTTSDLAKFFIALDNEKILSKKSMSQIMTPTILNDGRSKNYGLGWTVEENKGVPSYGHEGGSCAWIDYYPSKRLTVIVLSNLTGSKADEIVKKIAGFYL